MSKKSEKAQNVVNRHVRYASLGGFIPFPFLDIAATTGIQIKMLRSLAEIYEVPFSQNRIKSVLAALVGGVAPTKLAWGTVGSTVKGLPLVGTVAGWLTMPLFAGVSTHAVGQVFIRHFESGGTLISLDPSKLSGYFKQQFEESKELIPPRLAGMAKNLAAGKPAASA